jgi:hypothetical protein
MGLMYVFPVSDDIHEEGDRVEIKKDNSLCLKTYGLPMIFWGYLAAALAVLALMYIASKAVIAKLLTYDDPTLQFLGHLVLWTMILTPIVLLGFFFYEKNLVKKESTLTLVYKVFFIPFWSKKIQLKSANSITVEHFMDSPNMAKIRNQYATNKEALKHFENKGYFELVADSVEGKKSIDRHSRKADLIKMRDLLARY